MAKFYDWRTKALISCVSKDATRYHLNHIGYKHGRLYSTDGHRLFVTKPNIDTKEPSQHDILYSVEALKSGVMAPILDESRVVDWKQICGTIVGVHRIPINIPPWFASIKNKKSHGLWITETGGFSTEGGLIGVNPEYLAPIAVQDLEIVAYVKDELSPIVFMPKQAKTTDDAEWFYVVMPMRMNKLAKKLAKIAEKAGA